MAKRDHQVSVPLPTDLREFVERVAEQEESHHRGSDQASWLRRQRVRRRIVIALAIRQADRRTTMGATPMQLHKDAVTSAEVTRQNAMAVPGLTAATARRPILRITKRRSRRRWPTRCRRWHR